MIFFSVIIPTYNRAYIITETIESVLHQTYPNFEILIVDDGSTDNTEQLIRSQYTNNEKLKYFYKHNEERGAARNFGIKNAIGDYAVFLDSDDYMHNDYLFLIQEKLNQAKGKTINFITTKYELREESGKVIQGGSRELTEGFYDYKILLKGNAFGCMYAVKIDNPLLKLFPMDRKYATHEDWIFILNNLRFDKLFLIDKVAISIRQNDSRSTADNKKVIKVRALATEWMFKNIALTDLEKRKLSAWSHYYYAIHYYLDHKRTASVKESLIALMKGGVNKKFALILTKSILGRKFIKAIRK